MLSNLFYDWNPNRKSDSANLPSSAARVSLFNAALHVLRQYSPENFIFFPISLNGTRDGEVVAFDITDRYVSCVVFLAVVFAATAGVDMLLALEVSAE